MTEAQQYVADALELCQKAVETLQSRNTINDDDIAKCAKQISEQIDKLDSIKSKVFLKTKKSVNPSFAVHEASTELEDLLEDSEGSDLDSLAAELEMKLSLLASNVEGLINAAKKKSVIIT